MTKLDPAMEKFIASHQFDVERDNANDVIYASDLRTLMAGKRIVEDVPVRGTTYLPKITDYILMMVPADEPVALIENGQWTQAAVDFVSIIPVAWGAAPSDTEPKP